MPTINRDGVDIYYTTRGDGPALLLTHGYSATSAMWEGQLEAFSDRFTVIAWDMRGHGSSGSPRDDAAYSEALTVEDMAAILDHLGFEEAVIGGLSLGGYMSLAFHATFPQRVRALLIIDCGPGYRKDEPRQAWNEMALQRAADIEARGLAALGDGSAERTTAVHTDPMGLVYAARHMLTQEDARVLESLPDIKVPALVVAGAEDAPFLAATDYMAAKIQDAEKLIVANAGHAVNIDQPDAFNAGVRKFLDARRLAE